jgi:hypothetical protein
MTLKTLLVSGATCALIAGAAVAGHASEATSTLSPASGQAASPAAGNAAVASAVLTAESDGSTPSDVATQTLAAHHQRLCARVPKAIVRTQNLEKLLAANASTKGSLAWLQAKVNAAEAAHQDQRATALKNRLAFRKELASFLPHRLDLLQTAQRTICSTSSTGATQQ